MKKAILLCICLFFSSVSFSQVLQGETAKYENRKLIDIPTAGFLRNT